MATTITSGKDANPQKGQTVTSGRDAGKNPGSPKNDPVVDFVVKQFEWYERFHQERFEEARQIVENWKGTPPTREEDWQNQVVVPATLEAEQTITPRIFTALFPTDAPLDVKAEGQTPKADAITIKGLIQHFFRVAKVRGKSTSVLTQNTLLGTAYAEAGSWLTRRGWVIDPSSGERKNKIIENRPGFDPVDFFEIFPHPMKVTMDDGLPLIRQRFIDAETLKAITENPFFKFEKLSEALASDVDKGLDKPGPVNLDATGKTKTYEILDYWGPWDRKLMKVMDTGRQQEFVQKGVPHWIMIINRKVRVRLMPNPYNHQMPPFVKTMLFPDVRPSWFGVGVGKIGLPTQDRLNKLVNQRLDNVDLVLNKMGFYNGNDPQLNPKRLQTSKPGKWIKVTDTLNSVRWMDTPDVTSSSYKEEELAKADFRESVGASSSLQPSDDVADQHRTALGIQLLQGAAGMRFQPVLTKIEEDYIAQSADMFFQNSKQFMSVPEWVEIMGEGVSQMIEVTPEQIQQKVKFLPTGISETSNKETQISQLLRFKEVTQNDPTINRSELNKRIAELFGFKDVNKIIIDQAQGQPDQSGLSPEQQNLIKQRLQEGASPDQIKAEFLGPPPEQSGQQQG
jgi:hypothetical protein